MGHGAASASRGTTGGRPVAAPLDVARHAIGLAELAGHLGHEITRVVQELHAASRPSALWTSRPPARAVYGAIRLAFGGAGRVVNRAGRLVARELRPDAGLDVQSALNGAFGHLFAASGSVYALPMSLQRRERRPSRQRLVIFLHGLCMNERAWQSETHARFVAWAHERLGAEVAYLRYNTGLRISQNGARLAQLLENEVQAREIVLVGHSMGGLVARSALHQGQEEGLAWPRRVARLACLGAPHQGASLERLGNHANRLLRVLPWTRPFMRLGNLRSDGIRDLRFGHLVEADWWDRSPDDPRPHYSEVPLAEHVDHLFVAGLRREEGEESPSGDWLVSQRSALALDLHADGTARRERIPGAGHLSLLTDERVYRRLGRWLEDRPPLSPA